MDLRMVLRTYFLDPEPRGSNVESKCRVSVSGLNLVIDFDHSIRHRYL